MPAITAPPTQYSHDGYFTRYINANGIAILGTPGTSDAALMKLWELAMNITTRMPQAVVQALVDAHVELGTFTTNLRLVDLPQFRFLENTPTFDDRTWNTIRGTGGQYTYIGEETVLHLPGSGYTADENIELHEFLHAIFEIGVQTAMPQLYAQTNAAYSANSAAWTYNGQRVYAARDPNEYRAIAAAAFFDQAGGTNLPANAGINLRTELQAFDPAMYNLMVQLFGLDSWRPSGFFGPTGTLRGSSNRDYMWMGDLAVTALGGAGDDYIEGGSGVNAISGQEGNDILFGFGDTDVLDGGAGRDEVYGGAGDDRITIYAGHVLAGEIIDGGDGVDQLAAIGLNNDARGATISSIETLLLTFDVFLGVTNQSVMFSQAQVSSGLSRTLVISGSSTQDSIQLFAESGGTLDTSGWTFIFGGWSFGDYISYVGDTGNETFIGWPGLDIFFGSPGSDSFDGRAAFDFACYLFSPNGVTADLAIAGPQAIGGNQGLDTFLNLEGLGGSQFADQLFGDSQNNIIVAMDGDDLLVGRTGDDDLRGGNGNDVIEGGAGADTLRGEAGADRFVYRTAADGGDIILDFVSGVDRIEISAAGFGGGLVAGQAAIVHALSNPVPTSTAGQFLYDTDDGRLFWDADGTGSGAAVLLLTLSAHPGILNPDIAITGLAAASADGGQAVEEQFAEVSPITGILFEDSGFDFAEAALPRNFHHDLRLDGLFGADTYALA